MRKKKSILFIRPDYHCCFFYRDELRKQGWKVDILVDPDYPSNLLYSESGVLRTMRLPGRKHQIIRSLNQLLFLLFYLTIFWRYKYQIYYATPLIINSKKGRFGLTKLFGDSFVLTGSLARAAGCRLIFQPSGCLEEDLKADWQKFDAGNVCNNCGFFERCDDSVNMLNFERVRRYFDFSISFGYKNSKQLVERHIKYKSIDLDLWSPSIIVPPQHRLPRTPKIRILHSAYLKNSDRSRGGRNIKGSPFVLDAIERLTAEGHAVTYTYIEGKASNEMRFYQAQADIVVEQLIYGWWGSTGVETMALGKPVVCYIRPSWKATFLETFPEHRDLPIVEADTKTIYDVLKKLVTDPAYREQKGVESRKFAEAHFNAAQNAQLFAKELCSLKE